MPSRSLMLSTTKSVQVDCIELMDNSGMVSELAFLKTHEKRRTQAPRGLIGPHKRETKAY